MNPIRIFISSVQREFAQERAALRDYLHADPLILTPEQLRDTHPSVPNNRLLARSLYLAQYIEEMGTGTLDMIRRCRDAKLREPEFSDSSGFKTTIWRAKPPERIEVQPESQPESQLESQPNDLKLKVLNLLTDGPRQKVELSKSLGQKEISGQLNKVVQDLLKNELIEYTVPGKPTSRLQKYRLTRKGRTELSDPKSGNAV